MDKFSDVDTVYSYRNHYRHGPADSFEIVEGKKRLVVRQFFGYGKLNGPSFTYHYDSKGKVERKRTIWFEKGKKLDFATDTVPVNKIPMPKLSRREKRQMQRKDPERYRLFLTQVALMKALDNVKDTVSFAIYQGFKIPLINIRFQYDGIDNEHFYRQTGPLIVKEYREHNKVVEHFTWKNKSLTHFMRNDDEGNVLLRHLVQRVDHRRTVILDIRVDETSRKDHILHLGLDVEVSFEKMKVRKSYFILGKQMDIRHYYARLIQIRWRSRRQSIV